MLHVSQQRKLQARARRHGITKEAGSNTLTVSGGLNVCLVRIPIAPQHHRYAGHTFTADNPDFDRSFVAVRNNRGKAAFWKIDVVDPSVTMLQHLSKGKIKRRQMRL